MTFTITREDGTETTKEADAPYYDAESGTVYTNDRQRLMPRIVKQFLPEGFFITAIFCEGDLVIDDSEPAELEDAETEKFVVRDETGAKCRVFAKLDPAFA